MSILELNYSSIYSASRQAKNLADKAENYAQSLEKKVLNRISDLEGGSSTNTSSASYFTAKKIEALNKKKSAYQDYSDRLRKFVDDDQTGAKHIDSLVAKNLKSEAKTFRNNNNLKINPVTQFFTWLATGLANSCDFARAIGDIFTDVRNWLSDALADIKEWYHYEGGKYVVNIGKAVLAIGIAVLTIVATVLSGGIGLVAICAIVGAVIAGIDGIVSLCHNAASLYHNSKDPAWALKLSKNDKASTWLRKQDTGSKFFNKALNFAAAGLDFTETVCMTVGLVNSVAELGKRLPAIKNLFGDESKGLGKAFLDKSVRNKKGKPVVTLKSFRNGLKTLATDRAYRTSIRKKFVIDARHHFSLSTLKDTIRYQWKFGIKDTVKNLVSSKEERRRYLSIIKSGLFKDMRENLGSTDKVKKIKGVNNILKSTKSSLSSFGEYLAGKKGGILSKESIKDYIKNTYKYLDSTGNNALTYFEDLKSVVSKYKSINKNFAKVWKSLQAD